MIRLLCIEDDPLVRVYLTTRLAAEPDIEVVGSVPDIQRALIDLRRSEIDVVVLDFHLLGRTGTQLLQVMSPWSRWSEGAELGSGSGQPGGRKASLRWLPMTRLEHGIWWASLKRRSGRLAQW